MRQIIFLSSLPFYKTFLNNFAITIYLAARWQRCVSLVYLRNEKHIAHNNFLGDDGTIKVVKRDSLLFIKNNIYGAKQVVQCPSQKYLCW